MKIEISHDALAKKVYEKASAEDRMRLRVLNVFKTKFSLYKEKSTYLSSDELKLIAPFETQMVLSDEERRFLTTSKLLAQKQMMIFVAGTIITVALLVAGLISYYNAHTKVKATNYKLEKEKEKTQIALDSIQQLADYLLEQDSIQRSLRNKIKDREDVINMTNTELQNALSELQLANRELEKKQAELEKERDKLRLDKRSLTAQLKDHVKIKKELSTVGKSQALSQQAHEILYKSDSPTEADYKEAFKLSRAAWEMSKNNSQAMDVLNEINNKKNPPPNGGFLSKNRPKYTYTHKKIKAIIQKLDQKYNYGKLSPSELNRRLR